jgi:hypothetical protein
VSKGEIMNHPFLTSLALGMLTFSAISTFAADQQKAQTQAQEQIYGSQLITQQERVEYQTRMRSAKTAEEREQIRAEHHKQMQQRAKAQGATLPDTPPPMGGGKGPGPGGPGSGGYGR